MSKKIIFMGSPDFAVPSLKALQKLFQIVGVVTQPDRPAGRGRKPLPPPVKIAATLSGLPVIQPNRLKEPGAMNMLASWDPDLIVVAAFGQLLKPEVLNLPEFGCINIHASLLPRWRGAAPIQASILNGDKETGITIMKMNPGLDTGPIIHQRSIPISSNDTTPKLSEKLSILGAEALIEILPKYLDGKVQPQLQDESIATYAHRLQKEDGKLDFSKSSEELERQVRAFNPWPGTFMDWEGTHIKIHTATSLSNKNTGKKQPGFRLIYQKKPAIVTAKGILVLEEIQIPGKKRVPGKVFLNGAREWEN